jgi:hypothetical protein
MNHPALPKTLLSFASLCLLLALPLRADLNADLAFSAFSNVDLNALAGGQVLQARGGLLEFSRGITAQALYVIDAEPAAVAKKLVTWDPATHKELDVWIHHHLPLKPTTADFSDLASLPDNSSANYLVSATTKLDPNNPALQVSREETQLIASTAAQQSDPKALFVQSWSQILTGRIDHFLSGRAAADDYVVSGGNINSLSDIKALLHSDQKVYGEYQRLLNQTPVRSGSGSATLIPPTDLYYDCFDVEGYGALGTGAIYQASIGNSIQSADIEYYVNSGVYTTIELEQMWPVTLNGKTETLVWRADLVSTSNVAYLHGMERLASTMLMLQDVKQGIDAFRAEFK